MVCSVSVIARGGTVGFTRSPRQTDAMSRLPSRKVLDSSGGPLHWVAKSPAAWPGRARMADAEVMRIRTRAIESSAAVHVGRFGQPIPLQTVNRAWVRARHAPGRGHGSRDGWIGSARRETRLSPVVPAMRIGTAGCLQVTGHQGPDRNPRSRIKIRMHLSRELCPPADSRKVTAHPENRVP